jgi:hypothetical protein
MYLAGYEMWHSRPFAPTRRIALGEIDLPMDPAPGLGGLLLAAVVSANFRGIDEDLVPDVHRLVDQVTRGDRVVQPRLRHRYQVDRHGLARSLHSLHGEGETLEFDLDTYGNNLQQVLGAVYVLERFDDNVRRSVAPLLHRAMKWGGTIGPAFVAYVLGGGGGSSIAAVTDPRAWAMEILGFPLGATTPGKRDVQRRFRERLRDVHPDHGGIEADASQLIADITEARRVLLEGAQ